METLLMLARNVNWSYNTRNNDLFINSVVQLYNYVHPTQKGSKILTLLEGQTDTQIVGKAFSYFARVFDNGDSNINSVAAENAYYCLVKSIKAGNSYAAPEFFNLLYFKPNSILDKFIAARASDLQRELNIPIGLAFGDPFKNKGIIEDCKNLIRYVEFYIISIFYDIEKKQMKIPENMIECSLQNVLSTINNILNEEMYEKAIAIGKDYLEKVYLEDEETLLKY